MTSSVRAILALMLLLTAPARAAEPYEVIERAYAAYMSPDDPLAFPMKVRSLAIDPYKFWRGSKDLFFNWCKTNTSDWLADSKSFLPNHGDLHLGNIGSYASEAGWGKLAFGMVDFDDSAILPFQLELLQGLITLELTARQNNIQIDQAQLARVMFEAYRISVNSRRNATNLLVDGDDKTVIALLSKQGSPYEPVLEECVVDGKLRAVLLTSKGKLKDILRPAMDRADDIAAGIAQALENEPDLKRLFRHSKQQDIRAAMRDVTQRTRLDSSGSQGLKKYFVLLNKPLHGIEQDVVIYLKQEIPSAAERSGAVPRDRSTPGQRVKRDMDRLTEPHPLINSWCEIGGESYWVTFKEPWSDELSPDNVKTAEELLHMARIWGTVAGATHREEGRFEVILPRLTPALLEQIQQRSSAFIRVLDEDFVAMKADPRTVRLVKQVEDVLSVYGPH